MADETLLVVDDDAFMRELLTESLTEAGYAVTAAATAEDARDQLNQQEFQLAILDINLPDTEGLELLSQVSDASPDAQIIIMTGYPSLETAIQALREGAQDYIVKPFKVPEIKAAVDRAAKNFRLQDEVRALRRQVRDLEQEVQQLRTRAPSPEARAQRPRPAGLPGAYGALAPARPPPENPPEPDDAGETG